MTRPTPVMRDRVVPTAMPSVAPASRRRSPPGAAGSPSISTSGLAHAAPAGTGGTGDPGAVPSSPWASPGPAPCPPLPGGPEPPDHQDATAPSERIDADHRRGGGPHADLSAGQGQATGGGVEGDVHLEEAGRPGLHVEVEGVGDAGQHGDPLGLSVGEGQLVAGEGQGPGDRVGGVGDDGDRHPALLGGERDALVAGHLQPVELGVDGQPRCCGARRTVGRGAGDPTGRPAPGRRAGR